MKRISIFLLSSLIILSCSSGLEGRIDALENRVANLEKQCEMMNSGIEGLRSIVNALNQADFIKAVTPVKVEGVVIGYTLEFKNSPSITIYNGTDGEDAPVIGIKKDGDSYFWTLGGSLLLDENGNPIRVNSKDGITPRLKVEDGIWWISYDGGAGWEELGFESPTIFKDIHEDSNYVYIILFSGTEIKLPKVGSVISFEDPTVKMICVRHWDTDKDGELSFNEAAAVKSIGTCFQGMDILYFNEFVYFTGLEEIEENAFYRSGLQEIVLPASIRSIGPRAFYATPLLGISIPEGVESIGIGAFYACRSLAYANIPSSFTAVPAQMFAGCWSLEEIKLPEKTTKIGAQAFHQCRELSDVVLPSTLDTLENNAFAECVSFTEVVLPESVRSIGHSAFYGCENAVRIEFPDHITVLDHMVFHSCHSMESFTVPSSVETIGWYTFWDCSSLKSIIMKPSVPPSVRTDNSGADTLFKDCPEELLIFVPDVEVYESDPYWSRYSGMFRPIE